MEQLQYSDSWEQLADYPIGVGRNDDLHFFTPDRGFTINSQGYLLLTEDGGETWETKFRKERTFFRCLVFKDSLTGWLGTIGPGDSALRSVDSVALYETFDGGTTWEPTIFNGPTPKGLCGLQKVSDDVIVGCGRVRGPSFFIKTIDGGKTWNSYDLNHLAGSLIAPYFYDDQHGLLIGGTTTEKINCQSLVLETFDGGMTWDTIYISRQKGEYCWKFAWPTTQSGFISIQRNVKDGQVYVLQTKDGGKSWFENQYFDQYDYVQGIGFANEQVGWMGGGSKWTMETRDGGDSWNPVANIGRGFNNFQFFGDTVGYGVGYGIYKMKKLNPVLNGTEKSYYENGQLKSVINYSNGFKSGPATFYDDNGRIKSRGVMENNLRQGIWELYKANGYDKKRIKYKNGVAKVSNKTLKSYAGKYTIEPNVFRTITYKKGHLYSKHSKSDKTLTLYPVTHDEFVFENATKLRLQFISGPDGQIVKQLFTSNQGSSEAVKISN